MSTSLKMYNYGNVYDLLVVTLCFLQLREDLCVGTDENYGNTFWT